jgi:hypothetical protein
LCHAQQYRGERESQKQLKDDLAKYTEHISLTGLSEKNLAKTGKRIAAKDDFYDYANES